MNIAIEKYVFDFAGSNMYITISGSEALIIDPNISDIALKYLYDNKITEITVLLTHEHYDHTSGLVWLCDKFKSTVICHKETAESLKKGRNTRPIIIASNRMNNMTTDKIKELVHKLPQNYSYIADIGFENEYTFVWENHNIHIVSTPGHTKGSCCIEIGDNIVATGDSLILNTPVITRLPGGSQEAYDSITLPYLGKINDDVMILPGHGEIFYMKETNI